MERRPYGAPSGAPLGAQLPNLGREAELREADLFDTNLLETNLDKAIYDENTIFPEYFEPDVSGMVLME